MTQTTSKHAQALFLTATPLIWVLLYENFGNDDKKKLLRSARIFGLSAIARLILSKANAYFSWSSGYDITTEENYERLTSTQYTLSTAIAVFAPFLGEDGMYLTSGLYGFSLGHFIAKYLVDVVVPPTPAEIKPIYSKKRWF